MTSLSGLRDRAGVRLRWLGPGLALVLVFGYRFLAFSGFPNDHFVYVARAQQMLLGEWPIRDFVDPGFFLMYTVSAATQAVLGPNLLGEAILVCGGFAIAAALSYGLLRSVSGSVLVAAFAVAMQAIAFPRSYSYPKLPIHALALVLCWRYLSRPSAGRRVVLAALTAVAFLFRPDHGVVIGVICFAAVALAGREAPAARARAAAAFAAWTVILLLPWLVFVQSSVGVPQYLQSALGFTGRKVEVGSMGWPAFPFGAAAEAGFLSGLRHESVLYYSFLVLPWIGAAWLWLRRDAAAPMPEATKRLALVILLALCTNATLLRDPLGNRLADVAVPQGILAAWLLTAAWRAGRTSLPARIGLRTGAGLVTALLVLSTARLGAAAERFSDIPLLRPGALVARAAIVSWGLRHIEESSGLPRPMPLPQLVSYLRACTAPGDRVMYIGYAPETYFFAHRGFAGGHVVYEGGYYAAAAEQALTVGRLQRQRVPVIAMRDESAPDFRKVFDVIAAYIDAHYVRAGTIALPGGEHEGVYIDRRLRPAGVYAPLQLPCFRAG